MDLGLPALESKNLLESNPLKSRFLVRELTLSGSGEGGAKGGDDRVRTPW